MVRWCSVEVISWTRRIPPPHLYVTSLSPLSSPASEMKKFRETEGGNSGKMTSRYQTFLILPPFTSTVELFIFDYKIIRFDYI